jgi:hypothetical protein
VRQDAVVVTFAEVSKSTALLPDATKLIRLRLEETHRIRNNNTTSRKGGGRNPSDRLSDSFLNVSPLFSSPWRSQSCQSFLEALACAALAD